MDKWSLTIRVLAGVWAVHLLIILLKVWAAISGNYMVNWSQELSFYGLLVPTSTIAVVFARCLAAKESRSK